MVAQHLHDLLSANHQVSIHQIQDMKPEGFSAADVILLGTPSWDYKGQEGQPYSAWMEFFEMYPQLQWEGKKFAVFGLGDHTYAHFCGAVDVLTELIQQQGGEIVGEPLRIDQFYFQDQQKALQEAAEWAERVVQF